MSIAIIDYGMANLRSVQKAFETVGVAAHIVSTPRQIKEAEKIVLPGVGAFADAVRTLREKDLAPPILAHIQNGKPFLAAANPDYPAIEIRESDELIIWGVVTKNIHDLSP